MDFETTSLDLLPIGSVVQVTADDKRLRYMTMLVGIDQKKAVVTEIPTVKQLNKEGMKYDDIYYAARSLNFKTLAHGKVYSFDCEVMGTFVGHSRLLVTTYPTRVVGRKLRRETRFPCTLNCDILFDGVKSDGAITNISQGGCQFRMTHKEYRDHISICPAAELEVYFPFVDAPIHLYVDIKSVEEDSTGLSVGLAFDGQPASVKAYLDSLHIETLNSFFG